LKNELPAILITRVQVISIVKFPVDRISTLVIDNCEALSETEKHASMLARIRGQQILLGSALPPIAILKAFAHNNVHSVT
jgi:hypothetical protein